MAKVAKKAAKKNSARKSDKDTELALIEAATKIFAQVGYSAATVQQIAKAAGVNVSLISYYFNGKEGLHKACIDRFGKERLLFAKQILTPPTSVEDLRTKLRLWINQYLDCHIREPEITSIIHNECLTGQPHIKEVFAETFIKIFYLLVDFFNHAKKLGIIRAEINGELAAETLFGALSHIATMDPLKKEFTGDTIANDKYRAQLIENLSQLILKGLLK
jgi:TetR/AcrR family transcriptional regulator